jgi:tRNA:m4X modification enzyme
VNESVWNMGEPTDLPLVSQIPPLPKEWARCHAYIDNKRRYCRQHPIEFEDAPATDHKADTGRPRYCGNHQHLLANRKRKRIPCPADASHSVYEDCVAKHLSVCPMLKKQRGQEKQSFYRKNINSGGYGPLGEIEEIATSQIRSKLDHEMSQFAESVLRLHQKLFAGDNIQDPSVLSAEDIHQAIPTEDLSSAEFDAGLAQAVSDYRIKSGGQKHLHQQASLVGHLRRIGALPSLSKGSRHTDKIKSVGKHLILEVGAGRGMTGLVAAGVSVVHGDPTDLIMIERAGSRGKADTVLRNAPICVKQTTSDAPPYLDLKGPLSWSRVQCDLSHLSLSSILLNADLEENDRVTVLAKHLCGAGTDLALKALEPVKTSISSCILATCCHGVCNWQDYVGRKFLVDAFQKNCPSQPFGAFEFELLRRWSTGTVKTGAAENRLGENRIEIADSSLQEHGLGTVLVENASANISRIVEASRLRCGAQGLGRACQRLIDYGRQEYLRRVLFPSAKHANGSVETTNIDMLHYVAPGVTPQNAALVAFSEKTGHIP